MPATLELSQEQKTAFEAILAFVKDGKPELRIGGYAGTGKTYLIAHTLNAIRELNKNKVIALACFTGKAAFVLRDKLTAAEALANEYCGTIHGMMYRPVEDKDGGISWRRNDSIDADLVIIDEASMVNETIYNDLKKYNVPMLFIGDHGQLPPIGGQFGLMEKPDLTLTQIQRQAAQNPIIQLSAQVRAEGQIPFGQKAAPLGDGWRKISMRLHDLVKAVDDPGLAMFLCGYNKTRTWLNQAIRARLGFKGDRPEPGEKLICLKNNREIGIFNGMGGLLRRIKEKKDSHWYEASIQMEDGTEFKGSVIKAQFGAQETLRELEGLERELLRELFDFGYALTVHKAQGSEADRVILVEERFSSMTDEDWRRWLYTGVTRARKHLTVVSRVRA